MRKKFVGIFVEQLRGRKILSNDGSPNYLTRNFLKDKRVNWSEVPVGTLLVSNNGIIARPAKEGKPCAKK